MFGTFVKPISEIEMANGWASVTLELWEGGGGLNPSSFISLLTLQPSSVTTAAAEYIHLLFWCVSKIKAQAKRECWEPWKEASLKGSEHTKPKTHLEMIPACFHHICTAEVIYLSLKRGWLPVSESLLKMSCRKELSKSYCQMPRDLSGNKQPRMSVSLYVRFGFRRLYNRDSNIRVEGCVCGPGLCILSISWFPVCIAVFPQRK